MGNSSGKDVELPITADVDAKYTQVSCNQSAAYLLRSDGIVARSAGKGTITQYMVAELGFKYVFVTANMEVVYLLRSDGAAVRSKGGGKIDATIAPPTGTTYVSASAGVGSSYLVRSDGAVDRVTEGLFGHKVHSTMNPAPGTKYVQVSANQSVTYLLQDDGKVMRTTGKGVISATLECKVPYTSLGEQLCYMVSTGQGAVPVENSANYFLRADGAVDRTTGGGVVSSTMQPPQGQTYTAVAAGDKLSAFVRSDGCVVFVNNGAITDVKGDPHGGQAKAITIGDSFMYVLMNDGSVRRMSGSTVQIMKPGGSAAADGADATEETTDAN
jgi:hypothetical protein